MARYEHLPVYRAAMDLAVFFENMARVFPRYHRYTLGYELPTRGMAVLSLVVRANGMGDKSPVLQELRVVLEEIKQLLFLAKETKALTSFGQYRESMVKLESVIKQNEGWLRSQKKVSRG